MRVARDIAIVTALMALGTWFLGWWSVPLVAAAAALWDRNRKASVAKVTLAAVVAWTILLLIQGLFGSSVTGLGRDLAASLGVPTAVPMVLTIVLPALLAASTAATVAALKRVRRVRDASARERSA
ncbi:MAG: hypothetical protein ACREOG_08915 [Gemmatimonadaceae bacterium]